MDKITERRFLFHPVTVLGASILGAAIFALFVILSFNGDTRWFLLYYFTPIGIPFVAFLFDRAERYTLASTAAWGIDLIVVIASLIRAFVRVPLVSGHALFLSYCLLTARSKSARITAALVLLQVAYLKLFVTHDTALIGGVSAGCLAAFLYWRIQPATNTAQVKGEQ
ncbi:MAG TPA: hypothetical protein VHP14_14535 [Anaerolineales bacterium]|nr:hypothetical protein [Anaerolineales bacterium]